MWPTGKQPRLVFGPWVSANHQPSGCRPPDTPATIDTQRPEAPPEQINSTQSMPGVSATRDHGGERRTNQRCHDTHHQGQPMLNALPTRRNKPTQEPNDQAHHHRTAAQPPSGLTTSLWFPLIGLVASSVSAGRVRRPSGHALPGSAFEGVFDLLAGLLEVALGLVGLAFGLQVPIAAGLASGFLGFARQFFGLVFDLVVGTHTVLLAEIQGPRPFGPARWRGVVVRVPLYATPQLQVRAGAGLFRGCGCRGGSRCRQ